jgi:hypothetical protein
VVARSRYRVTRQDTAGLIARLHYRSSGSGNHAAGVKADPLLVLGRVRLLLREHSLAVIFGSLSIERIGHAGILRCGALSVGVSAACLVALSTLPEKTKKLE